METYETSGETVEAAIQKGLEELGAQPTEVMVEVLEEPHPGLMGEGARPARVRLVMMVSRDKQKKAAATFGTVIAPAYEPQDDKKVEEDNISLPGYSQDEISEEDADATAVTGKEVLTEILKQMGIQCTIVIQKAESTREGEDEHWVLNIRGQKVSRIIGRKGETLASLQYITRLIVSRKLQQRANIIVDADSYKMRRFDRLRQLALRMADQAVRQGRTITLEPMAPGERRIIHLTLRQRKDVETKSVGEGNSRKVTINPVT
ncbi:MAG: RNA-binding cell elongation regulator Jag/EloR [Aggregatilineales bacterium]